MSLLNLDWKNHIAAVTAAVFHLPEQQWRAFRSALKSVFRENKGALEYWKLRQESDPDEYAQSSIDFVNANMAEVKQSQ